VAGPRGAVLTVRRLVRELGFVGTCRIMSRKYARKLRHERLPNTTAANREVWTTHDWSARGEEWTPSPEWKSAIVRDLLKRYIPREARVLEIGPGGGRWTEFLITHASHLTLVDVTPACIEMCKERFAANTHIAYHTNNGTNLSFVAPESIDAIWSYDVFVHIASEDIEEYVRQFATILVPGGVGIIHHARAGVQRVSWRSDMTAEKMVRMCERYHLVVLAQTDSVDEGRLNVYPPGGEDHPDVVTIIRKPMAR
jgi:SAM-dependent methyltransferase